MSRPFGDVMREWNDAIIENGQRHLEKDRQIAELRSALWHYDQALQVAHERIQALEAELARQREKGGTAG